MAVKLVEEQEKSEAELGIQARVMCAKALRKEAENLLADPIRVGDRDGSLLQRRTLRSKAARYLAGAANQALNQGQPEVYMRLKNELQDLRAEEVSDSALSNVKDERNATGEEIEGVRRILSEALRQKEFSNSKRLHLVDLQLLGMLLSSTREKKDISIVLNQVIDKCEEVKELFKEYPNCTSDVMYLGRRETGSAIIRVFEQVMLCETESTLRSILEQFA